MRSTFALFFIFSILFSLGVHGEDGPPTILGGKDFLSPRGIDPGWELIVDELVGDEVHKLREKVEFVEQLGENAQEVKEHLNERLAVAEEELNEIGEKAKNEIREGLSHYRWEQLPAWFGPKPTEDRA